MVGLLDSDGWRTIGEQQTPGAGTPPTDRWPAAV